MGTHQLAFLVIAAMILAAAVLVVTVRNIFHAALALVLCFAGIAGIYVLLQAEFLAVAQVLIYIGAITVLILFAVMLTRHITGQRLQVLTAQWPLSLAGAGALFALLLFIVHKGMAGVWKVPAPLPAPLDSTTNVGMALVQQYVLPFEVASVILLAALVGAVVLAKDEKR